jgi:hypothetical protein
MPFCIDTCSIPSTKSLSRKTPTSPWSEKSVSVVKKVAELTDSSPASPSRERQRERRPAMQ